MSISKVGASIAELWRFPVKSMAGEQLQEAEVTERGILGDRAYALIETDTGKVVSAKSATHYPNLLNCKATFVEPPRQGGNLPPVRISLPDGMSVRSDSDDVDSVLSAHFKRNVTLGQTAPDDFTIDLYHPDLEGAAPRGLGDTVVAQKAGSKFFASLLGIESPLPEGTFFDGFPLSVMTTSTLARLSEHGPQSRFDPRRFRMNVILKTEQHGFVEQDWIGQECALGDEVLINVAIPVMRCVMTTLAQDDLPRDNEILRTLVQHNRIQVSKFPPLPCAGVYAAIIAPGTVRIGDSVVFS